MGTLAVKSHLMLALGLLLLCLKVSSAAARDLSDNGGRSGKLYPDKPPVMTIKTGHGDLVDCVEFYSQPAFGHPALKDHIIQMEPSSSGDQVPVRILKTADAEDKANWRRSRPESRVRCPLGTVPILRRPDNLSPAFTTKYGLGENAIHEHAIVEKRGKFNGTIAGFNVWNPHVDSTTGIFSLAQLWVVEDSRPWKHNTIEAGFHVYPGLHRDNQTRFFTYWTKDEYISTGCYNVLCPGFVQLSNEMYPGMVISPVSTYKGNQEYVYLEVINNPAAKRWDLLYGYQLIGYWPYSIFTTLADGYATLVQWGGETCRHHGTPCGATQMGSGHFPSEGLDGISSSVDNIAVIDANGNPVSPTATRAIATNKACYDIDNVGWTEAVEYLIHFGGPGSK